MEYRQEAIEIGGRNCILHVSDAPKSILLQPVDSHDLEELSNEITYIQQNTSTGFVHIAVPISKWNAELTPWAAPPVFGKIPFGDGASITLSFLLTTVIPVVKKRYQLEETLPVVFGGYSLAGLFALWCAYQPVPFSAIVAASPSAWYKDWLAYAAKNNPTVQHVYLSLGDKEDKTKTKMMATIKQDILRQEEIFLQKGVHCKMEWNAGNHFQDNGERIAKGFVWALRQIR